MKKYSTCQNGECKCGLIWDKDLDIPIAKVLTCKDKEMLGCGLIPESDEFKRVYRLLAAAPELLEIAIEIEKIVKQGKIVNSLDADSNENLETITRLRKIIMEAKGK